MRLAPDTRPTTPTSRTKRSQSGNFCVTMFLTPNAPTGCRHCVRLAFFVVSNHGHVVFKWPSGFSFFPSNENAVNVRRSGHGAKHRAQAPFYSSAISSRKTVLNRRLRLPTSAVASNSASSSVYVPENPILATCPENGRTRTLGVCSCEVTSPFHLPSEQR